MLGQFNYNYNRNVFFNPDVQHSLTYFESLENDNPLGYAIINNYRLNFEFPTDEPDIYEADSQLLNESIANGSVMSYVCVAWLLHEIYRKPDVPIPTLIERNFIKNENMRTIIRNAYIMNDVLKTYPTITNEDGIYVYRGESPHNVTFSNALDAGEGNTIILTSFTSTSLNPTVALRFNTAGMFKIHLPMGFILPYVSPNVEVDCELEVLLPFGMEFRIDSINSQFRLNSGEPIFLIEMTAVDIKPPPKTQEHYISVINKFTTSRRILTKKIKDRKLSTF